MLLRNRGRGGSSGGSSGGAASSVTFATGYGLSSTNVQAVIEEIALRGPIDVISAKEYGAAGVKTTTTLAVQLNSGSTSATLADASSFAIGHGMAIPGAGVAGAEIVVTLDGISGNVVSWASPATTTTVAVGATIYHDDTVAIKAAIATGLNVYFPDGDYVVLGGGQTTFAVTQNGQVLTGPRHEAITSVRGALIWSRSTSQDVFLVTGDYGEISNLFITQDVTTAASSTAGAGIVLGQRSSSYSTSILANRVRIIDVTVLNIYDGFRTEFATNCFVEKFLVANPRRYGMYFNSPAPTGGCWFINCQAYLGSPSWKASVLAGLYFENLDTTQFHGMRVIGFRTHIHYNANNNLSGYNWEGLGAAGCYQQLWTNVSLEVPYDNINPMIKLEGTYGLERIKFSGSIEIGGCVYIGGSNTKDVGFTGFTLIAPYNGLGFEIYAEGTHIGDGDITAKPTWFTQTRAIKIYSTAVGTRISNVRAYDFPSGLEIQSGATDTIVGDSDFSGCTTPVTLGTTTAEEMTIRNNSRFNNNIGLNSYGPSISYTPGWAGQEALVAGVFYKAIAITGTGDWKALN